MKTANTILKLLTAVATIAGAVYIIATYGEQIVAWAKNLLNAMPKCPESEPVIEEEFDDVLTETAAEVPEEPQAEEAAEPAAEEEAAAPEIVVAEHEPVAEEADFAE